MTSTERRRTLRSALADDDRQSRVRPGAGRELVVLDASNGGLLVEGDVRLLPGTHVDVHVVTSDGRWPVRSRVVRAWVSSLDASTVTYRGAVAFEQQIDTGTPEYGFPAWVAT